MNPLTPHVLDLEIHDDDRGFLVPLTNNLSPDDVRRVYICGNFARGGDSRLSLSY